MAVFGTLGTCCSYLPILYRSENKKNIFEKKCRYPCYPCYFALNTLIYIDFQGNIIGNTTVFTYVTTELFNKCSLMGG